MHCRACQRDHAAPECPVDELGNPSPPSVLIPALQLAGYGGHTFTSSTSTSTGVVISWTVPPMTPPDDGCAGVPALVR